MAISLGTVDSALTRPRISTSSSRLKLLLNNRGIDSGLVELQATGASSSVVEPDLVSQTTAEEEGLRHPLTATSTVPITDPRLTHTNHSI